MHQFQQLAHQLNWRVCAKRVAERRRDDEWNVGLHVLGRGVSIVAARVHRASEFMRGRRGRRSDDIQRPDTNAAAAPELRLTTKGTKTINKRPLGPTRRIVECHGIEASRKVEGVFKSCDQVAELLF